MTPPYIPLEIIENLVRQQHVDPRIIAAQGDALPRQVTLRQRLGGWMVLVGQRLGGFQPEGTIVTT